MSQEDIVYFRQKLARDISRVFRAIERKGSYNCKDLKDILRQTRKTRLQLELLEDAEVIYHERRRPDGHVWYIDTHCAGPEKTTGIVERFKECLRKSRLT